MKNSWIQASSGVYVPQARVGVREMHEEHISREGFFGPASMIYHEKPAKAPTRVEGSLAVRMAKVEHFDQLDEESEAGLPTLMLHNPELSISLSRRVAEMPFLLRNIDADTLIYVQSGSGTLATEFGPLEYSGGDYLYIPKGISYRQMPSSLTVALVVESMAPIGIAEHAMLGRHTPFDSGVLGIPEVQAYDWPEQDEWELKLKQGEELTSWFFDDLPFDVIGWKGDLFPFRLSEKDIRHISAERMHIAPSSWCIFESASFFCVAFRPMSGVSDVEAEELPSRHRNLDMEEVLMIRSLFAGVEAPELWHMPQAVTHGPLGEHRDMFEMFRKQIEAEGGKLERTFDAVSIDPYKRVTPTPAYLAMVAKY
ncbi:homogentisate 1,2-dioxygenase [Spongiibacter sp. KMU-166]|uniref:Homogentisate 1,2-dioxygenase n=1 Tax=Spongiibacter thalassae TaxID=2721624 RepID=A0ABX1GIA5_9GAMM|nr:homogentisate 1,2-dioxygenase [Spongiibacter thalassae]NKI18675.1 homogentisate 1,2-dioxygenase [Spongiibacter thalassae]